MSIHRRSRGRDVAIRLAGLTMLPIGGASINGLYHLVHVPPAQERTFLELGLAAGGFLSISVGSALLSLGAHLFDEVEISARWARARR